MTVYGRVAELMLRIEHRHEDGSWGTMELRPTDHGPADHDPEREWAHGQIYACAACDEQVRVAHDLGPPRG